MSMWVFGYGSLLWNPGFDYDECVVARLAGYARSFCMRSIHHRGTEEAPGLVLALDEAQERDCLGVAFHVPEATAEATLAYLRERELVSAAYLERHLPVVLADGRVVDALCYVMDKGHAQYCDLALEEQAQIIASAVGGRGPNSEYLHNTAAHLRALDIEDIELNWLSDRVRDLGTAQ